MKFITFAILVFVGLASVYGQYNYAPAPAAYRPAPVAYAPAPPAYGPAPPAYGSAYGPAPPAPAPVPFILNGRPGFFNGVRVPEWAFVQRTPWGDRRFFRRSQETENTLCHFNATSSMLSCLRSV